MAIIPRPNNRFKVVVYFTDSYGEPHRRCQTVTGITAARNVETQLKAAALSGTIAAGDRTTFGAYFDSWILSRADDVTNGTVSARTHHGNKVKGRALTKRFGRVKLASITPRMVREWLASMAKAGLSGTTRRHHYTLLRQVLNSAVREGEIPRNPCDVVKPPPVDRSAKRALSREQVAELDKALAASPWPQLPTIAAVMLATGARPGEAMALRWSRVDTEAGTVTIDAALDMDGTVKDVSKGGRVVVRTIPIAPDVVALLKAQRSRIAAWRLEFPKVWRDQDMVFPEADSRKGKAGRPMRPTTLDRQWKAALAEYNREHETNLDWTPHELRHTALTRWRRKGVRMETVQYLAGHAPGSKVTAETYTRHISAEELAAVIG